MYGIMNLDRFILEVPAELQMRRKQRKKGDKTEGAHACRKSGTRMHPLFLYGFSQLSTSEFLKREMEMHETKIHLLCGWSQIVIQKNTFPLQ